jgi:hypothetical protein
MDVGTITNLGVAGFAIFVIWKMSDRHAKQLDDRDRSARTFEESVRRSLLAALEKSTEALTASTQGLADSTKVMAAIAPIMERVMKVLSKKG